MFPFIWLLAVSWTRVLLSKQVTRQFREKKQLFTLTWKMEPAGVNGGYILPQKTCWDNVQISFWQLRQRPVCPQQRGIRVQWQDAQNQSGFREDDKKMFSQGSDRIIYNLLQTREPPKVTEIRPELKAHPMKTQLIRERCAVFCFTQLIHFSLLYLPCSKTRFSSE